jgi:hypothetical protein
MRTPFCSVFAMLTLGLSGCVSDAPVGTAAKLPAPGVVTTSAEELDFGVVDTKTRSAERTLTVTNSGTTAVRVPKVVISEPAFSIVSNGNGCEVDLGPGATCDVKLVLSPTKAGEVSANLTFEEVKGAIKSVRLRGVGRESTVLTVTKDGTGTGTVKSEVLGQIDCGKTCIARVPKTDKIETLTLSAVADEDSEFAGWSEPSCPDANPCPVLMSGDRSVTAKFTKAKYRLTVNYTLDQIDPTLNLAVQAAGATITCAPMSVCTQLVTIGDVVTLTPHASTAYRFSGECLKTTGLCQVTMNADKIVGLRATKYNYAFVTSARYVAGNLGGRSGADAKCTTHATNAGLPGNYKAWLATGNPANELGRADTQFGAGGYNRTDGQVFARNKSELVAGKIRHPLWLDEAKVKHVENPDQEGIHTGAYEKGFGYRDTPCGDWTDPASKNVVPMGATQGQTSSWTQANANVSECSTPGRLACLGADLATEIPLNGIAATARRAFVSAATINPSAGITGGAGFDALCQLEAKIAKLPNSEKFKALVATTTQSAQSRFTNLGGGTWVTVDGVPLAANPAMFFAGNLDSGMTQDAAGTVVSAQNVLTGYITGSHPALQGTATCDDWSPLTANTKQYGVGSTFTLSPSQTFGMHAKDAAGSPACNVPGRLYCLED